MRIEVRLFASLARYGAHPSVLPGGFMEFPGPVPVSRVADTLNIPHREIRLIFINGVHARMDSEVRDGDRLGFFPPIGGG